MEQTQRLFVIGALNSTVQGMQDDPLKLGSILLQSIKYNQTEVSSPARLHCHRTAGKAGVACAWYLLRFGYGFGHALSALAEVVSLGKKSASRGSECDAGCAAKLW